MTAAGFVGRVGGLAAALGAGVVIGLTTAESASAAPAESAAESGSGGEGRPSASSRRSPAGQADGAAGRPARPVSSSRPTGSDTSSPAAGLTTAQREVPVQRAAGSAPAPLAAAPKPARPPESSAPVVFAVPTVPVAATAATVLTGPASQTPEVPVATGPVLPAAAVQVTRRAQRTVQRTAQARAQATVAAIGREAAAGPIASFFKALFPCDPRGRLITIYKGTHFAIPNNSGFFIKEVSGTGTFTADTAYDLGDVDQFDWNKFTGIAFTPLEPDRDSVMVGWRYNLVTGEFEIAPFYNVNKIRIQPQQAEIISVPADQTFEFDVDYSGVTLTYGDTSVFKPFPPGLTANVWTAARVSGWFGGNEVAPRTVSYYLRLD